MEENLIIPTNLLKPLKDYKTLNVAEFIEKVSKASVKLFSEKDKGYNGSWQNKGILSVHLNFERKADRINAQFYNGTISSGQGENISDTLIDTSVYSLMYLFFLYSVDAKVKSQIEAFIEQYK